MGFPSCPKSRLLLSCVPAISFLSVLLVNQAGDAYLFTGHIFYAPVQFCPLVGGLRKISLQKIESFPGFFATLVNITATIWILGSWEILFKENLLNQTAFVLYFKLEDLMVIIHLLSVKYNILLPVKNALTGVKQIIATKSK